MANRRSWGTRLLLAIALLSAGIWLAGEARAQAVVDEARQAGRSGQSFPAADEDYFRGMDGGITLSRKRRADAIRHLGYCRCSAVS